MKKNKEKKEISWFVPLVLFLILCILIVGIKILNEFYKKEVVPLVPKVIEKKKPEKIPVAIIIDDCGWSKALLKELEGINEPLTLSFLPKAPYSKELIEALEGRNFDFMLHLPLEPMPPHQCFDKGLITTKMSDDEINRVFYDDVKDYLPYIKGINNHMGSLFTSDRDKMKIILNDIRKENLFFIDSMTSEKSVGFQLAKQMGIKTAKRDIFLDNKTDPDYIKEQVRKLVEVAKKNGKAVAIGHAKRTTLKVLKEVIPEIEKEGIEIVPASSIVE